MAKLAIQKSFGLALQYCKTGRLRDAEQLFWEILNQQPTNVGALHNLAVISHQLQRNDVALDLFRRAITVTPNDADLYNGMGIVLRQTGQINRAIDAYHQAITLKPGFADAHNNLGNALMNKGQVDEAVAAYRQAVALKSDFGGAYHNLGSALRNIGQFDESIAAYRKAIALGYNTAETHNNLGLVLLDKGYLDEAIAEYRQAIAREPHDADALNNLGIALHENGQLDESISAYRQALAIRPDFAEAHSNLALVLLLRGDFDQGWREYEWRWKVHGFKSPLRGFSQPLWDGSDLEGRSILLHSEQGFGDTVQFIRYVPLVVERGGRVLVRLQPELRRLLRQLPGAESWLTPSDSLPVFDVQCPLLSLPRLFNTNLGNIPKQKEPLRPDPELAAKWRHRMDQQPPGLKLGLVWSGNQANVKYRNRSCTLSQLAPLLKLPGISTYSLQKGEAVREILNLPDDARIVDWTDELHDFSDTAALIAQLDLIISIDTSVAHLAAAMGKPVWLLLPLVPTWRWLRDCEESPWYPTMRLFRQTQSGDWAELIQRVEKALKQRLDEGRGTRDPASGNER